MTEKSTIPGGLLGKRDAQKFVTTLAVAWQREVIEVGPGPQAEYYRAQTLGAIALYREVYAVKNVSPLTLLDMYRREAREQLGLPRQPVDEIPNDEGEIKEFLFGRD